MGQTLDLLGNQEFIRSSSRNIRNPDPTTDDMTARLFRIMKERTTNLHRTFVPESHLEGSAIHPSLYKPGDLVLDPFAVLG
jgi:hypothetical protein